MHHYKKKESTLGSEWFKTLYINTTTWPTKVQSSLLFIFSRLPKVSQTYLFISLSWITCESKKKGTKTF